MHGAANHKSAVQLAESLIAKNYSDREFSGRTLQQWYEVVTSRKAGALKRGFAMAAIRGLAAQIVRELIGCETVTIRFE